MADIIYRWQNRPNAKDAVRIIQGLELPQFRIVGHRKSAKEINLTTGLFKFAFDKKKKFQLEHKFFFSRKLFQINL